MTLRIAFYGSSLLSSYWNGAATYYRGLLADLARRGYRITFYEPDAYDRQKHCDIDPPDWARVSVYPATAEGLRRVVAEAGEADILVKASGVGVFDDELLEQLPAAARPGALRIFWDVDAAATLEELRHSPAHPLRRALSGLDAVFTYGGGSPAVERYRGFGARLCVPIYNALDPSTHHPVPADSRFAADLAFLGNRMPDREARVSEFLLLAARLLPARRFIIGGSGWTQQELPANVRAIGHVYTRDHNAFNATPTAVLNIARDSMAAIGFSPATRIFEAAGAGACVMTDAWEGIELFLRPGAEVLVARDGADVAAQLEALDRTRALAIGSAARARILAEHTYERRGAQVDGILKSLVQRRHEAAA